ncbi:Radical SAM domain protein [Nocardioides sp. JS614]|nr:Radical SAM domain protein [Nocardioides sp. JS614]
MSSKADSTWRGVGRPGRGELLISEIFGPTLQGEGPSAGKSAAFVRLGACNLACVWCDTSYTWDSSRYDLASELVAKPTAEVADKALSFGVPLVVITGGEPALQAVEAARLAEAVTRSGSAVELETSGSLPLGPLADAVRLIVVSPKLANAGGRPQARLRWPVLEAISVLPHSVLKFVVASPEELAEVDEITSRLQTKPERVWIMPEGTERETVLARMAELTGPVASRGWSLSSRLQVIMWGNDRGR